MKTRILTLLLILVTALNINAQRKISTDKLQIKSIKNAKLLGTDNKGNVIDNSIVLDTLSVGLESVLQKGNVASKSIILNQVSKGEGVLKIKNNSSQRATLQTEDRLVFQNLDINGDVVSHLELYPGANGLSAFNTLILPDITGNLVVDSQIVPKVGGNFTGNLVIDSNNSNTSIAGSNLTIKKESTVASTNVTQFIDVKREAVSTPLNLEGATYGLVSRVVNNSIVNDAGIVGANLVGRHSGNSNVNFTYGSLTNAEYIGSGNVNFIVADVHKSKITGTGTGVVDYIRGDSQTVTIDNPNITVNYAQGSHKSIVFNNGAVGNAHVLYLDVDYNSTGNSTVSGDFAYIESGNDPLPPVGGNSYFIKSLTQQPSLFSGDITAPNFIGNGSQLTNVPLPVGFYEEGTFTPVLQDLGGGATYTHSSTAHYVRVGNEVTFNINLISINTTGTPTGTLLIEGLPEVSIDVNAITVGQFRGGNKNFYSIKSQVETNDSLSFLIQDSFDANNYFLNGCTFTSGAISVSGTYITNVYTP